MIFADKRPNFTTSSGTTVQLHDGSLTVLVDRDVYIIYNYSCMMCVFRMVVAKMQHQYPNQWFHIQQKLIRARG